jgi:hypothetical protein
MEAGFLGGGAAAGGGVLVDIVERLLLALLLGAGVRDELKELLLDELLELGALVEPLRIGLDSRDGALLETLLEGRLLLDVDFDALAELGVGALGSSARERASERASARASERALRSSDAVCLASLACSRRSRRAAARSSCASRRCSLREPEAAVSASRRVSSAASWRACDRW